MRKKRTRAARPGREEEDISAPADDLEEVSPEQHELEDFVESLGPIGVSEVSLYRLEPNGKHRFLTSGPVSQFSELYVQQTFKGGDYLVRGRLNGRWYRSKAFNVADPPGTEAAGVMPNDSEVERLRAQIESQRLEMERDRREREQRNHELQLKMFESFGNRGSETASIGAMIDGVRSLKDLSGNGTDPLAILNQSLEAFERLSALRSSNSSNGDGSSFWAQITPVVGDVVRAVAPSIPAIVAAATAGKAAAEKSNGSSVPAMNPTLPALQPAVTPQPAAIPPASATPQVRATPPADQAAATRR